MKKLKLFLSLLMLMCLSVGNVWATDPVIIFQETFGDNGTSNTLVASASCFTATTSMFTAGHQTSVVSNYSAVGGSTNGTKVGKNNADVSNNTDASGKSAIWRQAAGGTNNDVNFFTIQNINIEGYTALSLKFNQYCTNGIGSGKTNRITVKYKVDNGSETAITLSPTSLSSTTWTWITGSIPATGSSLQLKFYHSTNGGYTIRVDDIILTGEGGSQQPTVFRRPFKKNFHSGIFNNIYKN